MVHGPVLNSNRLNHHDSVFLLRHTLSYDAEDDEVTFVDLTFRSEEE